MTGGTPFFAAAGCCQQPDQIRKIGVNYTILHPVDVSYARYRLHRLSTASDERVFGGVYYYHNLTTTAAILNTVSECVIV